MKTAMELAKRGKEVFTLMPTDGSDSWVLMEPGTLQEMLEGVMFFGVVRTNRSRQKLK